MRRIYLASSWRNLRQPDVVTILRDAGHLVYDFRNPQVGYANPDPNAYGFHWSEIDTEWQGWTHQQYVGSLDHPVAQQGFRSDWDAMRWADTGVLLLPSGRSAHLEAGYFSGAGKDLFILLGGAVEPELMYKMATAVCLNVDELLDKLARQRAVTLGYNGQFQGQTNLSRTGRP